MWIPALVKTAVC